MKNIGIEDVLSYVLGKIDATKEDLVSCDVSITSSSRYTEVNLNMVILSLGGVNGFGLEIDDINGNEDILIVSYICIAPPGRDTDIFKLEVVVGIPHRDSIPPEDDNAWVDDLIRDIFEKGA